MRTMQAAPVLGALRELRVQHITVLGQVVADATLTFHDSVLYGFFLSVSRKFAFDLPRGWITYDRIVSCRSTKRSDDVSIWQLLLKIGVNPRDKRIRQLETLLN